MSELEGGLPRAGEIEPGSADRIGARPPQPFPEAPERFVELAIGSVLDQVPEPSAEGEGLERVPKVQPWADTTAPPGRNKRPLEDLLAELRARVAAAPDARAARPSSKHPARAFFDRFGPPRREAAEGAGAPRRPRRRRRPRGRGRRSAS